MGEQNPRQPNFSELGILDRETKDHGFITAIHYHTKNEETISSDLEKIVDCGLEPFSTLMQLIHYLLQPLI